MDEMVVKGKEANAEEFVSGYLPGKRSLILARIAAAIFGALWLYDGFFKFWNNLYLYMPSQIQAAGVGQPAFLSGWFSFWYHLIASNPMLFTWGTGVLELSLGFALITGFLRKIAYFGGILLALLIWAVPEGFGGPYGTGSLVTGAANIYALSFVVLIAMNATFGPDIWTLDALIEKKHVRWASVAEIRRSRNRAVRFFVRHQMGISRSAAILLGIVFAVETYLAVAFNAPSSLKSTLEGAAAGQPAFLSGWYSFWISQVSAAPYFYYDLIVAVELLLSISLLFGIARKVAYIGGIVYALLEWSTLKAFGGPISAGYTDAGQVIMAIIFILFLALNAVHGTDPYTVDAKIEKRFPWWSKVAEMSPPLSGKLATLQRS